MLGVRWQVAGGRRQVVGGEEVEAFWSKKIKPAFRTIKSSIKIQVKSQKLKVKSKKKIII